VRQGGLPKQCFAGGLCGGVSGIVGPTGVLCSVH